LDRSRYRIAADEAEQNRHHSRRVRRPHVGAAMANDH
jgi:hypothetical protein